MLPLRLTVTEIFPTFRLPLKPFAKTYKSEPLSRLKYY